MERQERIRKYYRDYYKAHPEYRQWAHQYRKDRWAQMTPEERKLKRVKAQAYYQKNQERIKKQQNARNRKQQRLSPRKLEIILRFCAICNKPIGLNFKKSSICHRHSKEELIGD